MFFLFCNILSCSVLMQPQTFLYICRYIYKITVNYGHPVIDKEVGFTCKKIENPKVGYMCFLFSDLLSRSVLMQPRTSLYTGINIYNNTQQTKAIAMKFEPCHPSTPTARVLFTLRRWSSPGIDLSIYVVPESMNLDLLRR